MQKTNDSIWKKILITAIGTGASQIINFIFGIILVRILSVEEYAIYKQGNLILNTCTSFFFIISPISLSYFMAKAKDKVERKTYLVQTILSLIIVSFLGSLLLYVFRENIGNMYSNELLTKYFIYFAIIIFMETVSSYYTYYMVVENKNKKLAIRIFAFSLLRTIALGFSTIFKDNFFEMFLLFYVLAIFIKFIIILFDTYKDYKKVKTNITSKTIKQQIKFSIPIMIMGIINALNNNMDKNVVSMLYDPQMYSIYVNGAFEIPFISIISTSIITVMLPQIAQKFKEEQEILNDIICKFRGIIKVSIAIIIPIIFSIMTFSKEIVIILFSEKYIRCENLFVIYLFMILFKALNLSTLITAANSQYKLVKNGIIMIISNIVLIYLINLTMGFEYLTLAPVCATFIMNIMMIYDIKEIYHQTKSTNIVPILTIIKFVLIGISVLIIFSIIKNNIYVDPIIKTIILGPIEYIVMLAICVLTEKDLKNNVKNIIKRKN